MKIGKSDRPARTGRATRSQKPAVVRETPARAPGLPILSAAGLGITQAEFTPGVRQATTTLVEEIERLRRDIEQMRARLDETARAADQDTLLPILNRRAFVREISRFIAFAERYGTPSSLLYFDLDNFKAVNDAHGHAAGDAVLRHFADLLIGQIRESDVLARIGGDEFGVILAHVTLPQAKKKGAAIAQSLRDKPPVFHGHIVKLRFSCGVHELHAGQNPEGAMAQADKAMYAEKRAGLKSARR